MKPQPLIILGETILAGQSKTIDMEIANLHSTSQLKIPVIIERSKIDGPVVLFCAGIHGDEINGVEIVRRILIEKINRPKIGTIICIPIINMFSFINSSRYFPNGRDLNRVFPGNKTGSLASRFANHLVTEILPVVDFVIDFHAGGASRFNAPQIRIVPDDKELKQLADIFNAPYTLYSKNIKGSFRSAAEKMNVKMLLFEGGKSLDINRDIATIGVEGSKRFLHHFGMLSTEHALQENKTKTIYIHKSGWIRAKCSGLFHDNNLVGTFVAQGSVLGSITDPFGKFVENVLAPRAGYVINANLSPIVYEGDAVYHLSNVVDESMMPV